jgi:hypothetical protein
VAPQVEYLDEEELGFGPEDDLEDMDAAEGGGVRGGLVTCCCLKKTMRINVSCMCVISLCCPLRWSTLTRRSWVSGPKMIWRIWMLGRAEVPYPPKRRMMRMMMRMTALVVHHLETPVMRSLLSPREKRASAQEDHPGGSDQVRNLSTLNHL